MSELHPHREIAEFIAEGFASNDPVVVIAKLETRRGIEAQLAVLGVRPVDLECEGRACYDSDQVLGRILVDGLPHSTEFEKVLKGILFDGFSVSPGQRIRVYHDLVDVLRDREALDAAVLVLRLWNKLCAQYEKLLLAYTVAELYREKDCAVQP